MSRWEEPGFPRSPRAWADSLWPPSWPCSGVWPSPGWSPAPPGDTPALDLACQFPCVLSPSFVQHFLSHLLFIHSFPEHSTCCVLSCVLGHANRLAQALPSQRDVRQPLSTCHGRSHPCCLLQASWSLCPVSPEPRPGYSRRPLCLDTGLPPSQPLALIHHPPNSTLAYLKIQAHLNTLRWQRRHLQWASRGCRAWPPPARLALPHPPRPCFSPCPAICI